MKNHELDELLRSKLDRHSQVPGGVWGQIEDKLEAQERAKTSLQATKPKRKIWLMAASVLAVCATAGTLILSDKNARVQDLDPISIVQQENKLPGQAQQNNISESIPNEQPKPDRASNLGLSAPLPNDEQVLAADDAELPIIALPKVITAIAHLETPRLQITESRNPILNFATPLALEISIDEEKIVEAKVEKKNFEFAQIKERDKQTFDLPPATKEEPKVSYGMSGAYAYGSLKNGSTVALTTRRPLNDRFFIDGSVGLVMNNSSPYQANFKGDFIAFKREPQQITSSRSNLFTNSEAFYFVQINPSIGINVGKKLDFSLGTDYQQMLTNRDADVVMFQQSKLLPRHDIGLTGKTEFGITDNLKAGLMYREGITPIISNNNSISSRRYFQVMMKLQIWKKKKKEKN